MQINDNIKLIRELSGKTQIEFAELIKTNVSNLKTYENTNVKPKAYLILNIAKYAGISADDLENKRLSAEDIKFDDEKDENATTPIVAKYLALLEKTIADKDKSLAEKEADLVALRSAVNGINEVKNKVEKLEPIVNGLTGKVEVVESNIEVLREWLIDQFSKMKKESPQSVAASMGRKREELLKKEKQRSTHAD